jgi:hypothetical protein
MHINTGEVIQLTKNGGLAGDESKDGRFYYYLNTSHPNIIWQLDLLTLEESPFIREEAYVSSHVTDEGLYYFLQCSDGERELKFFRYSTGKTEQVCFKHPRYSFNDISPNERTLLLHKFELASDIYLVENF